MSSFVFVLDTNKQPLEPVALPTSKTIVKTRPSCCVSPLPVHNYSEICRFLAQKRNPLN
jgi:hypothetical protein